MISLASLISQLFMFPVGLYALLGLVPLILIYLTRPKPKKKKIPSIMFLMKEHGSIQRKSFFQRFTRDPIALLHFLLIILLACAIAQPYLTVKETEVSDNSIIVIDASASMNTKENSGTRFEQAISKAKDSLSARNTVILAKNSPELVAEDMTSFEALRFLNTLTPSATESAIYDAVIFGGDVAAQKQNPKVVVISDFIETISDNDLQTAKSVLESRGIATEFISVGSKKGNAGIIDMDFTEDKLKVWVRNYFDSEKSFSLVLGDEKKNFKLKPKEIEVFEFNIPKTNSIIKLTPNDEFMLDNNVYVAVPSSRQIRVLIISNNLNKYLYTALSILPNFNVDVTTPPDFPSRYDYDIVVYDFFIPKLMLPSAYDAPLKNVEAGKAIIYIPYEETKNTKIATYLPVQLGSFSNRTLIKVENENEITRDIEFGDTKKYFKAESKEESTVLATAAFDNSPIIAYTQLGKGYVFYYGIIDDYSDFKFNLYYPIFWKRATEKMLDIKEIKDLNLNSGKILNFEEKTTIKTPKSSIEDTSIYLDEAGYYTINSITYSSNLLNDKESDIAAKSLEYKKASTEKVETERKVPKDITNTVIFIILGLLLLELFLVKFRGDF